MPERVSIDFSMTSTAMVVDVDGVLTHHIFVPEIDKGAKYKGHRAIEHLVEILVYGTSGRGAAFSDREADKLEDAQRLSCMVADVIARRCTDPKVTFEGFSYASKGSSFIDLIVFNSFAKKAIIDRFGCRIAVLAPGTIKKGYSGKGNSRKPEMYQAFLARESGPLRDAVFGLVGEYSPDMKVIKPIDDLVDAVAIATIGSGG
jgi:hypothetical protein